MTFCTSINCMDGRVQDPVNIFLKKYFQVKYVDCITEPGPNRILADHAGTGLVNSILARIDISVNKHHSAGIAISGHYDCAGNPTTREIQIGQIHQGIQFLQSKYPGLPIIGLWVNDKWEVEEL